ncbi:MAG: hypothetical protein HRT44_02400 [Bdellovibrionales bacterium]|nr:hypothetical protein [Bdellovibrionales bacterium]NQZ18098.1 hypothetical protein [Bdellovibrionales bacterium]
MLFQSLILLFTLISSGNAFAQTQCREVFEVKYFKGSIIPAQGGSRIVHYLGHGHMGGKVFRIFDPVTGLTTLHKEYYDTASMRNDRAALKLLKEQLGSDPNILILEPIRQEGKKTLVFPDVRGFALDKYPNRAMRERLTEEFGEWGLQVEIRFEKDPNFHVDRHDREEISMEYYVPKAERPQFDGLKTIEIFLKPDNVIVDSFTGQMVIFDPY